MPSRATENSLLHIRENIYLARQFVAGLDCERFRDDTKSFYAVVRCLEIISEASRRLPDDIKAKYPHIPWREMAAAGNVYRHEYEDVRQRRVWATIEERFPDLLATVEAELQVEGR